MSMVVADADRLTAAANEMRIAADELNHHATSLTRSLGRLAWIGQIASSFMHLWKGGHRQHMISTASFIRDAATKRDAQAAQQRSASAAGAPSSAFSAAIHLAPPPSARPAVPAPTAPAPSVPMPGTPGGELPGTHRTWQVVQAAYDADYVNKYHLWAGGGPSGENSYQCVSWAWFRMHELGYTGPQHQANGKDVAGTLGGTTSTVPAAGAVMSYGPGTFGHVVIAEEVTRLADGRLSIRVSEMNTGVDAYHGNPDEYRSTRSIVQNANGTWSTKYGNIAITVANRPYTH